MNTVTKLAKAWLLAALGAAYAISGAVIIFSPASDNGQVDMPQIQ